MIITAAQLRAARGLLDWTRTDLAKAANISPETVKNIEHGTFRPQEQTAEAIVRCFAAHDVVFTDDQGVKISKETVKTYVGKDGYVSILEHIYSVTLDGNPITKHLALSDNYATSVIPDYVRTFEEKMKAIPNLDAKCLIWEGDYNFSFDYCKYQWLNKNKHQWVMPFYLYGDYVAFILQATPIEKFKIVSIRSKLLVEYLGKQFDHLWSDSAAPSKKKAS